MPISKPRIKPIETLILTSRLVSDAYLRYNDENRNSRHALEHSAFVIQVETQ